jgi:hypothetical protein
MKLTRGPQGPRALFPLLTGAMTAFLALAFLAPAHTAEPADLRPVLKQDFVAIKTWRALPSHLRDLIGARFEDGEKSMAEPGQPYQESCVVLEPKRDPARRLIFAARSGSTYAVCYESGGLEHVVHLVVAPFDDQELAHFILFSPKEIEGLATVRSLVEAGEYGASENY